MFAIWVHCRITWRSARLGMQTTQKTVCYKVSGMMFCDAANEPVFFQVADTGQS